jgi:hypothetical protein
MTSEMTAGSVSSFDSLGETDDHRDEHGHEYDQEERFEHEYGSIRRMNFQVV